MYCRSLKNNGHTSARTNHPVLPPTTHLALGVEERNDVDAVGAGLRVGGHREGDVDVVVAAGQHLLGGGDLCCCFWCVGVMEWDVCKTWMVGLAPQIYKLPTPPPPHAHTKGRPGPLLFSHTPPHPSHRNNGEAYLGGLVRAPVPAHEGELHLGLLLRDEVVLNPHGDGLPARNGVGHLFWGW